MPTSLVIIPRGVQQNSLSFQLSPHNSILAPLSTRAANNELLFNDLEKTLSYYKNKPKMVNHSVFDIQQINQSIELPSENASRNVQEHVTTTYQPLFINQQKFSQKRDIRSKFHRLQQQEMSKSQLKKLEDLQDYSNINSNATIEEEVTQKRNIITSDGFEESRFTTDSITTGKHSHGNELAAQYSHRAEGFSNSKKGSIVVKNQKY